MKKHLSFFLAINLLLFSALSTQIVSAASFESDPKLYLSGAEVTPTQVFIRYDITFAGFVELHLFDATGKKIWIKGVVDKDLGSHEIIVSTKSMKPGESYTYKLKYKGKDYDGSFVAP
jgi:hypothetical protein